MQFSSISIEKWRQFRDIKIDFHPRLTIITGANGSGKTSLLNILSQYFGWNSQLLATPKYRKSGVLYRIDRYRRASQPNHLIGEIRYSDGSKSQISVTNSENLQYNIQISPQPIINGLHISSHRSVTSYQRVENIPTTLIRPEIAIQNYQGEVRNKYFNGYTQSSPMHRMKEALISMANFGPGNQYVQGNEEIQETFEGFIEIIKKLLPPSLEFRSISIRVPDIVVVTEAGEFLIDSISGGASAIIDLAWQIYMYSRVHKEFVVTIDEPENHLHPEMQQTLMASLVDAFPGLQFIIATHSPLVVSSLRDSFVYALRPSSQAIEPTGVDVDPEDQTVSSHHRYIDCMRLDDMEKSGSSNKILKEVLGIDSTIPVWVVDELQVLVSSLKTKGISEQTIQEAIERLTSLGLRHLLPETLHMLDEA